MLPPATQSQVDDDDGDPQIGCLRTHGFGHVPAGRMDLSRFTDRGRLTATFEQNQQLDPNPGRRWRSHRRVNLDRQTGTITPLESAPYYQSPGYNPDDGGKQRAFEPIPTEDLTGPTLSYLIRSTLRYADAIVPDLRQQTNVEAGIHFISYRPDEGEVAFSSPIWLHRDDERFVSVTLFRVSENLGGGQNLLSPGGRSFNAMIDMRASMDMLLLTKRIFHAVVPMHSRDRMPAYRDVILVTFL